MLLLKINLPSKASSIVWPTLNTPLGKADSADKTCFSSLSTGKL